MGYFKDAVKGVSWMGALRGTVRLTGIVKVVILARILAPSQFGLFGIASLVLTFLEIIMETGINVFLIQGEGKIDDYLNVAWVVSIIRGFLISFFLLVLARPISVFFNSTESYPLLLLIATVPFLRGFINPSIIRFQKELMFAKEFLLRASVYIFDAAIAILLGLMTASATSLVWGMIAGVTLEVALSFVLAQPRPKLAFEMAKVKRIIGRGKWVTTTGFLNYLFREGDDWVVGKLLNTNALGIYQVAYKISTLPIFEVGQIVNKVTFPVYTKIAADKRRLARAFWRVTLVVSLFVIPFGVLLYLFTRPLVVIILGENWLSAVPVIRILAVFGVIKAITGSAYSLFVAAKKQEYTTIINLVCVIAMAVSIFPLITRFQVVGAGIASVIASIVSLPVVFYLALRVIKK